MNDETFERFVRSVFAFSMAKAREFGSKSELKDTYDVVCMLKCGIERTVALFGILGEEKFGELGEMLMERELKRTVEEAEEALGGEED